MVTTEYTVILAALALALVARGLVARTFNALGEDFVMGTAALAFASWSGPGAPLIPELFEFQKQVSRCLAFVAASPVLLIAVFGVLALVPAPGTSQDLTVLCPIAVALLLTIEFLMLDLLHTGAENAVSGTFTNLLIFSHYLPTKTIPAFGIYEVDPPHPRCFA